MGDGLIRGLYKPRSAGVTGVQELQEAVIVTKEELPILQRRLFFELGVFGVRSTSTELLQLLDS